MFQTINILWNYAILLPKYIVGVILVLLNWFKVSIINRLLKLFTFFCLEPCYIAATCILRLIFLPISIPLKLFFGVSLINILECVNSRSTLVILMTLIQYTISLFILGILFGIFWGSTIALIQLVLPIPSLYINIKFTPILKPFYIINSNFRRLYSIFWKNYSSTSMDKNDNKIKLKVETSPNFNSNDITHAHAKAEEIFNKDKIEKFSNLQTFNKKSGKHLKSKSQRKYVNYPFKARHSTGNLRLNQYPRSPQSRRTTISSNEDLIGLMHNIPSDYFQNEDHFNKNTNFDNSRVEFIPDKEKLFHFKLKQSNAADVRADSSTSNETDIDLTDLWDTNNDIPISIRTDAQTTWNTGRRNTSDFPNKKHLRLRTIRNKNIKGET